MANPLRAIRDPIAAGAPTRCAEIQIRMNRSPFAGTSTAGEGLALTFASRPPETRDQRRITCSQLRKAVRFLFRVVDPARQETRAMRHLQEILVSSAMALGLAASRSAVAKSDNSYALFNARTGSGFRGARSSSPAREMPVAAMATTGP